ncbi:hypothetical protein KP509_25G057100 [Ceratopteris richardii]|uniref:Uncharacterized protein n=1 Tax=Ceratopteris richardii TaxID=49495 RepID=A0A8T2RSW4_CERRI|nr:hypothetical protein KP509_25G057100 [Ceratopteris richardii]
MILLSCCWLQAVLIHTFGCKLYRFTQLKCRP